MGVSEQGLTPPHTAYRSIEVEVVSAASQDRILSSESHANKSQWDTRG